MQVKNFLSSSSETNKQPDLIGLPEGVNLKNEGVKEVKRGVPVSEPLWNLQQIQTYLEGFFFQLESNRTEAHILCLSNHELTTPKCVRKTFIPDA